MHKPELLAPAGNLEKLKIAFLYGADAVFVGTSRFGLRKYAPNFSLAELAYGVGLANQTGKHVYVVLNGFAHNSDMDQIRHYLEELQEIGPSGLIIADMGVFQLAKKYTTLPLHVSTQASVTNYREVQLWKDAGASRVILGREVSVAECRRIHEHLDIELEVFIHGAMCASYSGKCVISNYSSGRDSNRGGCCQSCRHRYDILEPETKALEYSAHIMNSKDLMGLSMLGDAMEANIASLKIEGRMKSNLYVANTVSVYRAAIDETYDRLQSGQKSDSQEGYEKRLSLVSNRSFTDKGIGGEFGYDSVHTNFGAYEKDIDFIGTVKQVAVYEAVFIELKVQVRIGDHLHLHNSVGERVLFVVNEMWNMADEPIEIAQANKLIKLPYISGALQGLVISKTISQLAMAS